jgi:glutamate 5-kinase
LAGSAEAGQTEGEVAHGGILSKGAAKEKRVDSGAPIVILKEDYPGDSSQIAHHTDCRTSDPHEGKAGS